jgi:clan AA aspartic protease (TIGR02281 family)
MRHLPWAAATLAAFLLGWFVGRSPSPSPGPDPGNIEAAHLRQAPAPLIVPVRSAPAADAAASSAPRPPDDPATALDRLNRLHRSGDLRAAETLRQRLLEQVLDTARAGRARMAQASLADYREAYPFDADAMLLESDLRQMDGRPLAAMDSLLALLQTTAEADAAGRARERLALLVGVHESQLASRGDQAGLIRFFENLAERDPAHDGHRLALARWLLRAGRAADAERVLVQTGVAGVDPEARADLAEEVRLARSGLPLEHGADAVHVQANQHGRSVRLLVDTGATHTVLGRDRASALAASPTGERVQVRTAAGVVEAEIHLVRDLQIGALHLDTLPVLVFDHALPDGVDGLLGMDVISRFGGAGRAGLLPGGDR